MRLGGLKCRRGIPRGADKIKREKRDPHESLEHASALIKFLAERWRDGRSDVNESARFRVRQGLKLYKVIHGGENPRRVMKSRQEEDNAITVSEYKTRNGPRRTQPVSFWLTRNMWTKIEFVNTKVKRHYNLIYKYFHVNIHIIQCAYTIFQL
jgi:hypothetical protein